MSRMFAGRAAAVLLWPWVVGAYTENDAAAVSSLEQADALVRETQRQFWQLVPPGMPLYVHSEQKARPVTWTEGWPDALVKQTYPEMQTVNGIDYPIYRLWVVAHPFSGDLTYFNTYGEAVWTSPAPDGYSPYGYLMERLGVESEEELTEEQKQLSASNVGMEIQLTVDSVYGFYAEDVQTEKAAVTAPPVPGGGGSSTNSGGVGVSVPMTSLEFRVPEGARYMEIFGRPSLTAGSWDVLDLWVPTYGQSTVVWSNGLLEANNTFFFMVSDAEIDSSGNGRSDLYESLFPLDGPQDSCFPIGWCERLFAGDTTQGPDDDFDGDGLVNGEELVQIDGRWVLKSDPSMVDSDGDGLGDFDEVRIWGTDPMESDTDGDGRSDGHEVLVLRTDPLNPDTTPPVIELF